MADQETGQGGQAVPPGGGAQGPGGAGQPGAGPEQPAGGAPEAGPPPVPTFSWGPREDAFAGAMSSDDKTMGLLCHLLAFAGYVVPLGNVLGPLILWLVKKEGSPYVDEQGKESLNFQITIVIYALVTGASICIGIGIVLLPLVGLFDIIMIIIAAVKSSKGIIYRYPLCIRFIK